MQTIPYPPQETPIIVMAMYKFVNFIEFKEFRPQLQTLCRKQNIYGTILLAPEGLNGTVSGHYDDICILMEFLQKNALFTDIEAKFSFCIEQPFHRMKVRLKKEIVTLGQPSIDPENTTGAYIPPKQWNNMLEDPDTIVIDTRNDYEVEIGTFKNALDPKTKTFREFVDYVENTLKPMVKEKKPKNIAMFCTGGIRCEKSTSYLLQEGFKNVYHLKGGILKYIEMVQPEDSLWEGECFVFDNRVSVKQGLEQGEYDMCHACRMPITQKDKTHKHYQAGIACHKCHGSHSEKQLKRYSDRQKQVEIFQKRGTNHIGQV